MIIKSIQKVLSVIVLAAFLNLYLVPAGMCAASVPQINTGVQKPVLRENGSSSALKLEGDISISKVNPRISLSLRDSDVKQVLRMFADKAGLNIIFHSSVDTASSGSSGPSSGSSSSSSSSSGPKVTLDLVNVPLNDAFKMVLQVSNLTYYIDNNTLIVAAADAALKLNLAKQELMIIPVKYVDAGSMATFLNKNIFAINKPGLSNGEIAITNPSSNEILIFGTKNDFLMAKKVVAQFDKKPLEETFIVNHTTPKEMATLICNVLLKVPASSSGGSSSSGTPTGGAADSGSSGGSSSGSSGSSGGSSGSSSGGDLSLGAGTIACQYNNSVKANNLSSLSTNNLTVSYFPQKGTISAVGGSVQQLELIRDFILKNDKKQPQAYLEVSIIELNESGSKEFYNTWNVWWNNMAFKFDGTTATNPAYPTFLQNDTTPDKLLSKYAGTNTVSYTMSYLIKNGKGRVLANPRILITNGQTSKIDLVSDYVSKVDATTTGGIPPITTFTYTIASDNGIQIELVPYISLDGYVTLNIKPTYATIAEKVPGKGLTDGLTVATLLNKRNLDLKNIRIKDGETLTIGGLITEDEHKNVNKFPVLGDLPGIGMFFRNTDTQKTRQELVIMITPKIIKDSEDVVNNNSGTTL